MCVSGSRLRETATYAHIFMTFYGLLMRERSERTGHNETLMDKNHCCLDFLLYHNDYPDIVISLSYFEGSADKYMLSQLV